MMNEDEQRRVNKEISKLLKCSRDITDRLETLFLDTYIGRDGDK